MVDRRGFPSASYSLGASAGGKPSITAMRLYLILKVLSKCGFLGSGVLKQRTDYGSHSGSYNVNGKLYYPSTIILLNCEYSYKTNL